jgi:large subunit ribosomal protein L29
MTKAKDMREQSNQELENQLQDLRKEIFTLKNGVASKREDVKPAQIQVKKKDVARILTVLRERQLQETAK